MTEQYRNMKSFSGYVCLRMMILFFGISLRYLFLGSQFIPEPKNIDDFIIHVILLKYFSEPIVCILLFLFIIIQSICIHDRFDLFINLVPFLQLINDFLQFLTFSLCLLCLYPLFRNIFYCVGFIFRVIYDLQDYFIIISLLIILLLGNCTFTNMTFFPTTPFRSKY